MEKPATKITRRLAMALGQETAAITRRETVSITRRETVEFGLVATLATLVMGLYHRTPRFGPFPKPGVPVAYIMVAIGLTLVTIIAPRIFYPFAFTWFSLSRILGRISSAVLLTLIFVLFVVPVGLVRKWRGLDPLQLKAFKKGTDSVLVTRRHVYVKEDLLKTF